MCGGAEKDGVEAGSGTGGASGTQEIPAILAHVSIGVSDYERSKAFYSAVLGTLGAKVIMEVNVPDTVDAVAFGKLFPEFWVQTPPLDGNPPSVGNGTHFAFLAADEAAVQAFWDTALANGAKPDGAPGPRPHYGDAYYGCFVRDPDGHKIEAMAWNAPAHDAD